MCRSYCKELWEPCAYIKIGTQIIWHLVRYVVSEPCKAQQDQVSSHLHSILDATIIGYLRTFRDTSPCDSDSSFGWSEQPVHWVSREVTSLAWEIKFAYMIATGGETLWKHLPEMSTGYTIHVSCFESPGPVAKKAKNSLCRRNHGGRDL